MATRTWVSALGDDAFPGSYTTGLGGAGTFVTYGNNRISGNGGGNSVPGSPAPVGPQ